MPRLVHLGINPIGSGTVWNQPKDVNATLERLLSKHGDWYRYAAQNYVLFTDANLTSLATEIRTLPGFQHSYCLLVEIGNWDPNHLNGWIDPKFWQWINGKRWYPRA